MRRLAGLVVALFVAIGCSAPAASPTALPTPTAAPTPSPSPSPTPSPSPSPVADSFDGQPYIVTVPPAWRLFDLSNPTSKAALDAFVAANPDFGPAIGVFESIPGVRMAVNPLLGESMLIFSTPTGGIPLDTISTSFQAQFQAVPGLKAVPTPTKEDLPGGPAYHWALQLTANKPSGGSVNVDESVYLFANDSTAVVVEFVTLAGGLVPEESSIIDSFRFR
ncbi:MAG TPA: hypothetical protein VGI98_05900 [Candidatus Limnocylindrales bacterium]|jgi:hypothetical protein